MPNQFTSRTLAQAITGRYAINGECWEWTGKRDRHGYGKLNFGGRTLFAHRVSFEDAFGRPAGVLLHTCDNPPCIRPEHLSEGTQADNVADAIRKGRIRHGFALRPDLASQPGERHPMAKLSSDDVLAIREAYARGPRGIITRLAWRYNVSHSQISRIVRGQRWAHPGIAVTGDPPEGIGAP